MAIWTTPPTLSDDDPITKEMWNLYAVENSKYLLEISGEYHTQVSDEGLGTTTLTDNAWSISPLNTVHKNPHDFMTVDLVSNTLNLIDGRYLVFYQLTFFGGRSAYGNTRIRYLENNYTLLGSHGVVTQSGSDSSDREPLEIRIFDEITLDSGNDSNTLEFQYHVDYLNAAQLYHYNPGSTENPTAKGIHGVWIEIWKLKDV